MQDRVDGLEEVLDHAFRNRDLAIEAITHSSARGEHGHRDRMPNTRLAFLGDAVMELAVRHHQMPDGAPPGAMTEGKQKVVTNDALGPLAIQLGFADIVLRSKSHHEPDPGEKLWEQALEAAIGAVFLDAGYEEAARVVKRLLNPP